MFRDRFRASPARIACAMMLRHLFAVQMRATETIASSLNVFEVCVRWRQRAGFYLEVSIGIDPKRKPVGSELLAQRKEHVRTPLHRFAVEGGTESFRYLNRLSVL